jgi:hypothetical protein
VTEAFYRDFLMLIIAAIASSAAAMLWIRARTWKRRHKELVKHCAYLTLSSRLSDGYAHEVSDTLLKLKKAHETISEQSSRLKRENDELEIRFRESREDFHRVSSIMKSLNEQLINSKKGPPPPFRGMALECERMVPSDGKL